MSCVRIQNRHQGVSEILHSGWNMVTSKLSGYPASLESVQTQPQHHTRTPICLRVDRRGTVRILLSFTSLPEDEIATQLVP